MEINIKMPVAVITALESIAYELKELRLSLCPPLRGSRPVKPIDPKAPSQVKYPRDLINERKYREMDPPAERREDQG